MKKGIKQKNTLKDLIYIQENKPCNKQTVKGLFRAILEPVLEEPVNGVVLHRVINQDGMIGLLKRLEYTNMDVYDFSDGGKYIKEESWENTEFVYVLTERYGVCFIWDYDTEDIKDEAGVYLMYNSKSLMESFDLINANCQKDLNHYQDKYKPERRENIHMNSSIRRIVDMFNETTNEVIQMDNLVVNNQDSDKLDFINKKSRYIAHEIRNQLSVCDLYSTILKKYCKDLGGENQDKIDNAIECIIKSVKIAGCTLSELKDSTTLVNDIQEIRSLVETAVSLGRVYAQDATIDLDIKTDAKVLADENKFVAVLVNLLKNAAESMQEVENKRMSIVVECNNGMVSVLIENNGHEISDKNNIFTEGYTTKTGGSGLGLYICKKSLEEQFAQLKLVKSDQESTIFEILVGEV